MLNLFSGSRRHKMFGMFAFLSVIIVVVIISITLILTAQCQILMLNQAEQISGSIDVLVTPKTGQLNGTAAQARLPNYRLAHRQSFLAQYDEELAYALTVLNFKKENIAGIGNLKQDSQKQDAFLPESIALTLGIQVGEYFKLNVDLKQLLKQLAIRFNATTNSVNLSDLILITKNITHREITFKATYIIKHSGGKLRSDTFKRNILVEQTGFLELVADTLKDELDPIFIQFIQSQNIEELSDTLLVNFEDRYSLYIDQDIARINYVSSGRAYEILSKLGNSNVEVDLPVVGELQNVKYGKMYTTIVMKLASSLIFFLSFLLVYSFLTISLNEKVNEVATIQLLGMTKYQIYIIVITQSAKLMFPAILIGIILIFPTQYMIFAFVQSFFGQEISNDSVIEVILYSGISGFLVPITASIFPIYNLLNIPLREMLDHQQNKTKGLKIDILREDTYDYGRLLFAIICVVFGSTLYFVLPMSIFTFNFLAIFSLMFLILIGYLAGFILLSINIHFVVEKVIYQFVKLYTVPYIALIALKNLSAHRIRNRNTSLIYSVSIAFVLFLWSSMQVIIENSFYYSLKKHGCEIHLKAATHFQSPQLFEQLLNENKDLVDGWSWVTEGLSSYKRDQGLKEIIITSLSGDPRRRVEIFGILPNLQEVTFPTFWEPIMQTEEGIVPNLYTESGHHSIVIPYVTSNSIYNGFGDIIQILLVKGGVKESHTFKVSGILNNAPGFKFKSTDTGQYSCLVSFPTYIELAEIQSLDQIPLQRLVIKLSNSGQQIAQLLEQLLYNTKQQTSISVFTLGSEIDLLDKNRAFISTILLGLVVLVMLLSSFSLVTSMTANVHEQVKEIALLKAVGNQYIQSSTSQGLTNQNVSLVFNRESFILIISSCMIGIVVGTIAGYTMTNQTLVFQFAAGTYQFPWIITIVVLVVAVFQAQMATTQALKALRSLSTAELIRME